MLIGRMRIIRQPRAYGESDPIKEYWERLAKMAPIEVTGLYLTLRPTVIGNATPADYAKDPLIPFWPWIGVALVLFVRVMGTRRTRNVFSAQWGAVIVALFSFIFWVLTMGHYMAFISDWITDSRIIAVGAAVFTFVVPYFYKGDLPQAPMPRVPPADINPQPAA